MPALKNKSKKISPAEKKSAGLLPSTLGEIQQSDAVFQQALISEPANAVNIYITYANDLKNLGQLNEAVALLNIAIANNVTSFALYNTLGLVYLAQNNQVEAAYCFKKTILMNPKDAAGYINYGLILLTQGQYIDAEAYCSKALELSPNHIVALNNLGLAQHQLAQYEASIDKFKKILSLDATNVNALSNIADPLKSLGRLTEAENYLKKGLLHHPDHYDLLVNLASIYQGLGCMSKAIHLNLKASRINPNKSLPFENLIFGTSFTNAYSINFINEQLGLYGKTLSRLASFQYQTWTRNVEFKALKIGFVSADFILHPVTTFLNNVLENLNQDAFELVAYSNNSKEDVMTRQIKQHFKTWHTIIGMSDAAVAALIHKDSIDILIDLSGHTGGNRLQVFAYKPAPIQMSWLGYWASTGVEQMDYILIDEMSAPLAFKNQCTEKIKYLPETRFCYSAPKLAIEVSTLPALNNGFITFGCYHTYAKVSDEVLSLWAKVLTQLPKSVLRWQTLAFNDQAIVNEVHQKMLKFSIANDRIKLIASQPYDDYFKSYHQVDFVLDSFPFTACTTTSDALWMGVPTLTIAGNRIVERQGASLMSAVGLQDWVTKNQAEFVEKALFFAGNTQYLARIRAGLRQRLNDSSLGNAQKFAQHFEQALKEIWQKDASLLNIEYVQSHDNQMQAAILEVYEIAKQHELNGNLKEAKMLYLEISKINRHYLDVETRLENFKIH